MRISSLPKDFFGLELRGRTLGRYDLLHRITRGGMSEVLLGQLRGHAGFRKLVILKRVAADNEFGGDVATQMLIREARLTAGFVHSNIAQVFDLELIEGGQFLSMEFVPGVTLNELRAAARERRERLPLGLCLYIARDVAEALHYAHTFAEASGRKRPVIHRDVAPKNVMIRWDGVTKLLDFGLAKTIDGPSQTLTGTVKGTVSYMSPEQIRGRPLDGRTDLFSLGVVLYELLSGAPITSDGDETPPALRTSLPPLSSRVSGVPAWLDGVLSKLLAPDPALRFATGREVSRELLRLGLTALWEQDAVSDYLEYLFAHERAQMQRMLLDLAPDETTSPVLNSGEPTTRADRPPPPPPDAANSTLELRAPPPDDVPLTPLMDEPDPSSARTDAGVSGAAPAIESKTRLLRSDVPQLPPEPSTVRTGGSAGETATADETLFQKSPRRSARARPWPYLVLGAAAVAAMAVWYFALRGH